MPSAVTWWSITAQPASLSRATTLGPAWSSRVPSCTPSDTTSTLATRCTPTSGAGLTRSRPASAAARIARRGRGGIVGAEHRAAGDEDVDARGRGVARGVDVDAAVDLDLARRGRGRRSPCGRRATLSSTSGMNGCPPQPGFTLITSRRSIWSRYGSTVSTGVGGLSTRPDAHVARPQLVEQRARVAELDVHDAAVGAGVGEVGEQHAGVVDHEVAVEEQVGVRAQRLHHRRADGEVGHEVAVHHVDVQEVGDLARPARRRRPRSAKSADRIDGASFNSRRTPRTLPPVLRLASADAATCAR